MARLVLGEQDLVQLLARADADHALLGLRRERSGDVHHPHARALGHEHLAALDEPHAAQDEVDRLVERDPEARHPLVGDVDDPRAGLLAEHRHHAAAAADDVAVAHGREARRAAAGVRHRLREQLLGAQLGRAVEVDRVDGLVGAERERERDVVVDRRRDHVLGADHVRLNRLERVVLTRRHLLERGGVDDHVDAAGGEPHAVAVAYVTEQQPHAVVLERALELRLLELVTAEDPDRLDVVAVEHGARERGAERAGRAGDEQCFAVEVHIRHCVDRVPSHPPPRAGAV
jgi:hypothetical protein